METCKNCGRFIGELETPHLWQDHVVCSLCIARLRGGVAIPYATPTTPQPTPLQALGRSIADPDSLEVRATNGSRKETDRNEVAEEIRRLRADQHRRSQDSSQKIGCLIFVVGLVLLCVFWPAGLVVMLVGLVLVLLNTRLS